MMDIITPIVVKDLPVKTIEALSKARTEFQEKADFKKVKTDGLKYPYLPIEQAKPLIEEVTANNGICIVPMGYDAVQGQEFTYHYEKESQYNPKITTKWYYQTADVVFLIAGPDGGFTITVRAEAQDNSDKSTSKLYTAAYKNLVKIMFGFAESPKDDPDATQEEIYVTGDKFIQGKTEPRKSMMDPKIAVEEAKRRAEKDKIIKDIRFHAAFDKNIADGVRDVLLECGYTGTNDIDELCKALRQYMNTENLKALLDKIEMEKGRKGAAE